MAPENRSALAALGAACVAGLFGAVPLLGMFPLILPQVAQEFGVGRGQASLMVTLFLAANAIGTPLLGKVADVRGARAVAIGCVLGLSGAALALSQLSHSPVLTFALIAALGALCPMVAINNRVVAGWFERRRGLAMAVVGLTTQLLNVGLLQLNRRLLEEFGWRSIYLNYALIALIVAVPILVMFYRERGRTARAETGPPAYGLTAGEARRDWVFWMLVAITSLNVSVVLGMQSHMVALLTDRGLSRAGAVNLMSLSVFVTLILDPITGAVLDRFNTPKVCMPYLLSGMAGLLLLSWGEGLATPFGVVLILAGAGQELLMMPYMMARYFGLRSFSELYGTYYLIGTVGMAGAPLLMGYVFDATGAYTSALLLFMGLIALALLLVTRLPAYRFGVTGEAA